MMTMRTRMIGGGEIPICNGFTRKETFITQNCLLAAPRTSRTASSGASDPFEAASSWSHRPRSPDREGSRDTHLDLEVARGSWRSRQGPHFPFPAHLCENFGIPPRRRFAWMAIVSYRRGEGRVAFVLVGIDLNVLVVCNVYFLVLLDCHPLHQGWLG